MTSPELPSLTLHLGTSAPCHKAQRTRHRHPSTLHLQQLVGGCACAEHQPWMISSRLLSTPLTLCYPAQNIPRRATCGAPISAHRTMATASPTALVRSHRRHLPGKDLQTRSRSPLDLPARPPGPSCRLRTTATYPAGSLAPTLLTLRPCGWGSSAAMLIAAMTQMLWTRPWLRRTQNGQQKWRGQRLGQGPRLPAGRHRLLGPWQRWQGPGHGRARRQGGSLGRRGRGAGWAGRARQCRSGPLLGLMQRRWVRCGRWQRR